MILRDAFLSCLGLLCAGTAWSQLQPCEPVPAPCESRVRFSGFGTAAVMAQDMDEAWNYRRDILQPNRSPTSLRADVDSRLGLQANVALSPQFEAVGQIVFKSEPQGVSLGERISWAFLAYRPTADLTLRVGRTTPDVFLLANYRNVGFAYPWVRPNTEFYGWMPLYGVDGADVAKRWRQGSATWQAKAFYGDTTVTIPAGQNLPPSRLQNRAFQGLTLSREDDGLLLKVSYARVHNELAPDAQLQMLHGALQRVAQLPLPGVAAQARALQAQRLFEPFETRYLALGASFDRGPWLMHAEAAHVHTGESAEDHAYVSIGRRVQSLTFFTMAGMARSRGAAAAVPNWQATLAASGVPALVAQAGAVQQIGVAGAQAVNRSRLDQRSVSLGMRWDVHPQMSVKAQWDHVQVGANGAFLWSNASASANRGNLLSFALDFVF